MLWCRALDDEIEYQGEVRAFPWLPLMRSLDARSARKKSGAEMLLICYACFLPARLILISAARSLRLETLATIHRSVFSWLEGHLCLTSAACTRCRIHLARFSLTIATTCLSFACGTAGRTTAWHIGQTSAGIKFLLASSKHKFLIAVATIQSLISS